jgi:hypothetical protein
MANGEYRTAAVLRIEICGLHGPRQTLFDVRLSENGKFILTPLAMGDKPNNIRPVRKHGYPVAVGARPIRQEQVRKFIDDFDHFSVPRYE